VQAFANLIKFFGGGKLRCTILDKDMSKNTCSAPAPVVAPGRERPARKHGHGYDALLVIGLIV
jgi:hypothetical protein